MLMRRTRKHGVSLGTDGVVALEFAIIAPVMGLMLLGTFDIARALFCWQQAVTASNMVALTAQVLVAESIYTNTDAQLSTTQATQAMTAVYAAMPWLRQSGYNAKYSVALSSVQFTSTGGATPVYTANLAWSVGMTTALLDALETSNGSNNPLEPGSNLLTNSRISATTVALSGGGANGSWCGTPIPQVATVSSSASTMNSIPTQNVTTPGTLLVADVYYRYNPVFPGANFITSGIDFWATSLVAPSGGATNIPVDYDKANAAADTAVCSAQGYS